MQNNVLQELGTNFIEYAVAVNTDRAIPDAKSGLKPVAKRIIYDMFINGFASNKPHVKCARTVGDVMGKFHPHGDSSIYGALVRLSQPWALRYPLIDFHGNQGNIAGDGPASMRYTEARLSKISEDGLLNGIKKHNVDFIPNYDETEEEPITLPAIFPNLLCNPNTGIGVAMACNWLPHNLKEVSQAIYDYMDNKEPTLPGPDFPLGGLIINGKDISSIMKTGHGSIKLRARYKIDKNNIIFYEIPYGQTIENIIEEVNKVCEAKEIEGIREIYDATNNKGIKIVVECDKTANPDSVAAKLYAKTNLQTSISYNQVALINKVPTEMTLVDCCKIYVEHNIECLIKELTFDLDKAKARLHIIEGLLVALEDIDNVISLIKKSTDSTNAKEALMKKYNLDEIQAKSILAMRLSSLAHMEKIELENEEKELINKIEDIEDIIAKEDRQKKIIKNRLAEIVKKYGDARRTEITNIEIPKEEKEIIEVIPEDVVVVTTKSGLIKRVPVASFKVQKRGGKGTKTADDIILDVCKTNTIDTMMFFTSKGKMYRTVVDNIPVSTNAGRGTLISDLIKIDKDEKIIAVSSLHRKTTPKYIIFITKNGLVKKSLLEEYTKTNRNSGISAITIKDNDELVDILFQDDEDIILVTENGMAIRFETKTIASVGRVAQGIKGIKLNENDGVVAGISVHKETDTLAIITSTGLGKKVVLSEIPIQGRNGKGISILKTDDSKYVAGATMISDEDNILIIGISSSICISASDIPELGRTADGNILIRSRVKSITKI